MTLPQDSRCRVRTEVVSRTVLLCLLLVWMVFVPGAATAQTKKAATGKRPLSQADVQKLWVSKDDALLSNEIRLRGLAFTPTGYWLDVKLPELTGIKPSHLPAAAASLRKLIPAPPDVDVVAKEAPDLLNELKVAAQKQNEAQMQSLLDSSLMINKAVVYNLFDSANFRASSLGKSSLDEHGDVILPFFELSTSNVEKLYYLLFGQPKGKLIVLDIVTGPTVADLYLHDQQALAATKLETMFRALDDGDQSGVRDICTPGLYESIQSWGGISHPGDRLSRGHQFSQVTAQTSVPLDQKSIRVVTKVSYPLTASNNLTFFVDFERVGNDLKVVRLRDSENKVIVFDPNIDNYVNRRYGLPDGPPLDPANVATTEETPFLSTAALQAKAMRALQYHDPQQIAELAKLFVESNPTGGDGYGIRAAVDLMQHKYEDADKDANKALELNGTAYFIVERNSLTSSTPFSVVVLGVSKSKINYLPASGAAETIDMSSVKSIDFEKGIGVGSYLKVSEARPFLKLSFKGDDGKKGGYNFADYGTACPGATASNKATDLVNVPGGVVCGTTSSNRTIASAQGVPLLAPATWREDLTVVLQAINTARNSTHR